MFCFVCDNSGPREVVSNSLTMVPSLIPNGSRKLARNLKPKTSSIRATILWPMEPQKQIIIAIKKFLHLEEEYRFCWDKQVSLTCLAINTSYLSSIKEILFYILNGRGARLPFNDLVNKLPDINYSEEDYATEMSLRLS